MPSLTPNLLCPMCPTAAIFHHFKTPGGQLLSRPYLHCYLPCLPACLPALPALPACLPACALGACVDS